VEKGDPGVQLLRAVSTQRKGSEKGGKFFGEGTGPKQGVGRTAVAACRERGKKVSYERGKSCCPLRASHLIRPEEDHGERKRPSPRRGKRWRSTPSGRKESEGKSGQRHGRHDSYGETWEEVRKWKKGLQRGGGGC